MKCSICKNKLENGEGSSSHPVKDGKCCNICNIQLVIPFRNLMSRINIIKKECFNYE